MRKDFPPDKMIRGDTNGNWFLIYSIDYFCDRCAGLRGNSYIFFKKKISGIIRRNDFRKSYFMPYIYGKIPYYVNN